MSQTAVVKHLAHRLASELALGNELRSQLAITPAGHHRDALEQHLEETARHAERARDRLHELGWSDRRGGLGSRLTGRTRALAQASAGRLAGAGSDARILEDAMDDCAAVAREVAAYTALERLARGMDDERTAALATAHLVDEECMLQRLLAGIPELAGALLGADKAPARPVAATTERSDPPPHPPAYDGLSSEQVIARMGDVSQDDLSRLAVHERHHHNRAAVLERIAALQGDEPWPGYDALSVTDVGIALSGANPERLDTVLTYERDHKNRDTVLAAASH